MQNVILIVHLLLALTLIAVVLLQRSEGGGLGIGGGGGPATGRSAQTAVGKMTWGIAAAFIATSLALGVLAIRDAEGDSVTTDVDVDGIVLPDDADTGVPGLDPDAGLLPDLGGSDGPLLPDAN